MSDLERGVPMADRGRDAATLALQCIQAIAEKDVVALRDLFADDGKWELAYALEGMSDAKRTVHGGDKVALFHRGLNAVVAEVCFPHVEAFAVNAELAFVEFTSDAVTTKGLAYGNSYVAKVSAKEGCITHWVEFYDPRPAEMVRRDLVQSLAESRAAGPE